MKNNKIILRLIQTRVNESFLEIDKLFNLFTKIDNKVLFKAYEYNINTKINII